MIGGLIGIQRERPQELHHRREAATLLFPAIVSPVGAAQCQQLIQFCPVSPHHHVEQIPGQHSQGFAAIEAVVRVRGLVVGQAKQAFIHQRQGVGHRLALLFTDLHGKGVFRFHLVRGAHLRDKTGVRVIHQQRHQAIKPDGPVVVAAAVRLQQRHMHVHVGRHIGGDGDIQGLRFTVGGQPVVIQYP